MSGSEYHDFVQLGAEGQVAPTFISQPGALTTGGLPIATAQVSTQTNPGFPSEGISSIVQAEQVLAVTSSYSAPGSRTAV
jgi:hypothetical protein